MPKTSYPPYFDRLSESSQPLSKVFLETKDQYESKCEFVVVRGPRHHRQEGGDSEAEERPTSWQSEHAQESDEQVASTGLCCLFFFVNIYSD